MCHQALISANILVERIVKGKFRWDGVVPDDVCGSDQRHLPQVVTGVQIYTIEICYCCADTLPLPLSAFEWPIQEDTFDPLVTPNAVVGVPTWYIRSGTKEDLGTVRYAEAWKNSCLYRSFHGDDP